jgi:hypothetical protein
MNWARVVRVAAFVGCVLLAAFCALKVYEAGMLLSPRVGLGLGETEFDRSLHMRADWFLFLVGVLQIVGAWMLASVLKRKAEGGDGWEVARRWFYGLMACCAGTIVTVLLLIRVLVRRG